MVPSADQRNFENMGIGAASDFSMPRIARITNISENTDIFIHYLVFVKLSDILSAKAMNMCSVVDRIRRR